MPRPIRAARGTGRPQTSIMPPKEIATSPPMAPTARFIWPTARVTICAKATTDHREKAISST